MNAYADEKDSRIIDSREGRALSMPILAAGLSTAAAITHAWVVRSHLTHWWGYGAFFASLALAQGAYAWLIVRRPSRRIALAGIAANAGILVLYVFSRAVSVPVGPHAGKPEAVGIPDLVCAAAEAGLIATLLWMSRRQVSASARRLRRINIAAVAVVLIAAGMAGPIGHAHPRLPSVALTEGPEAWVGMPPTPAPATPAVEEQPVVEPEPVVEETPCVPVAAANVPVPEPTGPGEARGVVYTSTGGVWMYDPARDDVFELAKDDDQCWATDPAFRSATYVSFGLGNAYYGMDLTTREIEQLFASQYNVMAADWSSDGTTLAYITYYSADNGGPQLVLYRPADGSKEVIRTFPEVPGRCGSEDDETSVSWAPDGHALIVVMTATIDEDRTMFVTDLNGNDLVPARSGTSARWAPDSKRVYYRDFLGDRKWHTLSSETGDTGTLGAMKPGTFDLEVSSDGTMLAYHDGLDDVGTYIFDVATKTQRKVADDAVMAVWIGPRTILVTDTKPCGDECFHSAWTSKDTTSTVDVFTKERKDAAASALWDADAWVEVPAEPAPSPEPPGPDPIPTESPTQESSPSPAPSPSATPSTEPSATPSTEPSPDPSPTPTAG